LAWPTWQACHQRSPWNKSRAPPHCRCFDPAGDRKSQKK